MSVKINCLLIVLLIAFVSMRSIKPKTHLLQTELSQEVQKMPFTVEGKFPEWLNGVLVRNSSIPVYKDGMRMTHDFG